MDGKFLAGAICGAGAALVLVFGMLVKVARDELRSR